MASQNVSRGNLSISGKTFISDTSLDSSVNNIAVIDSNGEIKVRGVDTLNNIYITGGSYNCTTSTLSLNNTGGSPLGTANGPYLRFNSIRVRQSVMDSDGNLYAAGNFSSFENTSDINNPTVDYPYRWDLDGVAKLNYPSYELNEGFKTHGANYGLTEVFSVSIDSSKNIYIRHPFEDSISGVSAPMRWSVIGSDGTINTSIDFQSHILVDSSNNISSTSHVFVTSNDKIILAGVFNRYSGTSVTYANQMIGLNPNGSVYGNFHQVPLDSTNSGGQTNTWPNFYEDPDGNIYFWDSLLVTTGSTVIYDFFRTDSLGNFDSNFTPFTFSPTGDPHRVKVYGDYVYLMGWYSIIDGVSQISNIGGVNHYPGIIRFNKTNGTWDSSYKIYFSENGGVPAVTDVHFYDDGSMLVIGKFDYYSGTSLTSKSIVKIKSDLTIDTTTDFGTGISDNGIGVNLHITPDNNFLITGSFSGYSSDDQWEDIVKIGNNSQSIDIPFNVCDTFTGGTSSGTTITIEGGCCDDIVITGVTGVYVTGATADYTGVTLSRNDDVNVLIDSEQTIRTKYTGVTVGTTTLVTIPVAQFFGTHIEYAVTNGTGVRTGILIGSFEGGTKVEMSDVCTADTTDFSADFEFDITASGQVQAIVTSGTYTIVFNTRAIEI